MRERFVTILVLFILCLSGCSDSTSFISRKMLEKSGIEKQSEYINYLEQEKVGNIDEEGYYSAEDNEQDKNGSIHVTFATNRNLNVSYFTDKECTKEIDITGCYLNPGDVIYATVSISRDIYSTMYEFSGFKIFEYDSGKRYSLNEWELDFESTGIVCSIPEEFIGTELAIEPMGEYKNRELSLNDYYVNEEGSKISLDGTWIINDTKNKEESVIINAISPYLVSYEYDTNEFFFRSSEPECFYSSNEEGIIIFNQYEATDDIVDFSVELCKYITTTVYSSTDRTVSINDGIKEYIRSNYSYQIGGLQYGEVLTILTNKRWVELEKTKELILKDYPVVLRNGDYKYTCLVPEKDGQFLFDPSEYSYEHGSLRFKCRGEEVTSVQYLARETKIYYEVDEVDPGYTLAPGENYVVVQDEAETRRQLESIQFQKASKVSVSLNQPEAGGEILYYVDGKRITDKECTLFSGNEIVMEFDEWEGWICHHKDGEKYIVTQEGSQTIEFDEAVFEEDKDHKPALTVVLEKNVGKDIRFDFSASGLDSNSYHYSGKWYQNDYKIIDGKKIGTEIPITISMNDKSIPKDKAVKIVVTKTTVDNKSKTSEIRYVNDFSEVQKPIYIYAEDELATSKAWYKEININVSIVDAVEFKQPTSMKNADVSVYISDTNQQLAEGDFLEKELEVKLKISPKEGYYIKGGNKKDETVFQDTMRYSKLEKQIDNLLEKHCAKKVCLVVLDESDTYASYTYKYNGKEVSGKVSLREGEKLTLTYEIKKSGYKLSEAAGGFWGIGKSDKKITQEITISANLDGTTITRNDFGIEVEKGQ